VKYFVISLHRSGTLSTAHYLSQLGLRARHWPIEHNGMNLEDKVIGREADLAYVIDVLSPVLEDFQAVADVPMPVLYRELFTRYPHARFIFAYRNAFDWVRSIRAHYNKAGKDRNFRPYARVVYWKYFHWRPQRLDELTDAQLMWMYSQHTADVIDFFIETAPANLGVFDLCAADVGEKIAVFVGIQSPVPFPHFNRQEHSA
jgi:hypothetical protein